MSADGSDEQRMAAQQAYRRELIRRPRFIITLLVAALFFVILWSTGPRSESCIATQVALCP